MNPVLKAVKENQDEYRPIPFWSWNDKLEKEKVEFQIEEMKKQGLGGYFMHARGGLETEYLSDDWMDAISWGIEKGKETGLAAWCYDENGWPSGFADGKVPALGFEHHIKWLELYDKAPEGETVVSNGVYQGQEYSIVLKSNRFYVDTLSEETTEEFIKLTHEKYYSRFASEFGKGMPGFFTDEPQYMVGRIPWTLDFPKKFKEEYGYDITESLICLFKDEKGCEKIRNDYWKLVAKLFRNAMGKKIYDWCDSHNAMLTGHVMMEDNLTSQISATGGAMGFYENMHIPGIDWLCRAIASPIIPKQLGSACAQFGRKKALSEMFALCGWDVSFNELKWIAEWQFVNGVNLICQHLEGYSLRGFRKRDFPPSLFIQQPWWNKYHRFNDYFSKLGALLGTGKDPACVLMLHPMNSQYVAYSAGENDRTRELEREFLRATNGLSEAHVNYHYGDEYLMSVYGSVEGNTLKVGECSYNTVVLPYIINMSKPVFELLSKFKKNGGKIYSLRKSSPVFLEGEPSEALDAFMDDIPEISFEGDEISKLRDENAIGIRLENGKECGSVHCTSRLVEGNKVWFCVNLNTTEGFKTTVEFPEKGDYSIIDLAGMKVIPIAKGEKTASLEFKPYQSYVIAQGVEENQDVPGYDKTQEIKLPDKFEYKLNSPNAITLDACEYRIENGEWQEKTPVTDIQWKLTESRADCDIYMRYKFEVKENTNFKTFGLALECLEKSEITVNGKKIANESIGFYVDRAFSLVDITGYVHEGENELIIKRHFYQSQRVYDVLFGKDVFETERNKLTYDTELESIYLIGDFGVYSMDGFESLERNCLETKTRFYIDRLPDRFDKGSLTQQGLLFFSGSVDLTFDFEADKSENTGYYINAENIHAVVTEVLVNGESCGEIMFSPFTLDVTKFLKDGLNKITLRLYSGNRNLLGPHHHNDGECYAVSPHSFGWERKNSYCFVKFGVLE